MSCGGSVGNGLCVMPKTKMLYAIYEVDKSHAEEALGNLREATNEILMLSDIKEEDVGADKWNRKDLVSTVQESLKELGYEPGNTKGIESEALSNGFCDSVLDKTITGRR